MGDEIKFNIFKPEEYDSFVKELLSLSSDLSVVEIQKIITEKFSLTFIPGQSLTKDISDVLTTYRIRVWNPNDDPINENDFSSFSYPPLDKCKIGRVNTPEMQVLYTSLDRHTPFYEMSQWIEPNISVIYLSKWGIKSYSEPTNIRNMFFGVPFEGRNGYSAILARAIDEGTRTHFSNWAEEPRKNYLYGQKKFNELFCAEGKEYYHITSSIGYDTFIRMTKQNINMPIITYPSIAKGKDGVNFAFRKDFVDEHMHLLEVQKMIVKKKDKDIEATLIARGVNNGDEIIWQVLKPKFQSIDYTRVCVVFNNDKSVRRLLKPNEKITNRVDPEMNIQEFLGRFFRRNNVTEEIYIQNILSSMPGSDVNTSKLEFPVSIEATLTATTEVGVFLTSDLSPSASINSFILPFIYTLDFDN